MNIDIFYSKMYPKIRRNSIKWSSFHVALLFWCW